ncbi:MAG: hypothetical protein AAGA55_03990 [Planctomycetota bacterium]
MGIGMKGRAAVGALFAVVSATAAQPFTYQGSLSDGGQPADGLYDVRITLLNDGGGTVAGPLTFDDIAITDGVFSVELDFGAGSFDGSARLLGLEFRDGGSAGGFTELLPNTPINPTPYALYAFDAFSEITRSGNILRIGEGDGSDVAIVNPTMPDGAQISSISFFQVNVSAANPFGGMYVNMESDTGRPFYGFANEGLETAFIEYLPQLDELALALSSIGPVLRAGQEAVTSEVEVRVRDDVRVSGTIYKDYGSNEFHRAAPSAYGSVRSAGFINFGTSNVNVTWNSALSRYEITFDDFVANTNTDTILVTPIAGPNPRFATVASGSNQLWVYIFDLSGNQVQSSFGFMVYENDLLTTTQDAE